MFYNYLWRKKMCNSYLRLAITLTSRTISKENNIIILVFLTYLPQNKTRPG